MPYSLTLRPGQQQALDYQSGPLAIAAVPGSGKTFILEVLITDLIVNRGIDPERIGVFTYMRSARANLLRRINNRLRQQNQSVRFTNAFTLHSLSLKILKAFQGRLPGEDVTILEQYEQDRILSRLTRTWLRHHTHLWEPLLPEEDSPSRASRHRVRFGTSFQSMCSAVIRTAKAYRLLPSDLKPNSEGFLSWGTTIYQGYQTELNRLGLVDYDDLGWRALDLIERDRSLLFEVQGWYDYLLEDEAQDSSPLQDDLLLLISGGTGNLVRVGDPNQSIMGTFTTAEPQLFRDFCATSPCITLDESSRSAPRILFLANQLVQWVTQSHPLPDLQSALAPQWIQCSTSGPKNPSDEEADVQFCRVKGSIADEFQQVVDHAIAAVRQRPDQSVAILVPRNDQGADILACLKQSGFDQAIDLLRNNPTNKRVIERIQIIVSYLAQPTSITRLVAVIEALADWVELPIASTEWKPIKAWLQDCLPEELIFPNRYSPVVNSDILGIPERYWLPLSQLFQAMARWLQAARAPWSDVLNVIIQDLYRTPEDLFLSHYVVDQLELAFRYQSSVDWDAINAELKTIAETRLNNLPSEITAFAPDPGTITVATVHRSKGSEWDEVIVTGVSAYDYPVTFTDRPMGLAFLDGADIQAEALAELRQLIGRFSQAGSAKEQAFLDLAAERLRLFYVGMTRAKRRLVFTVSSRNQFDKEQRASALLTRLQDIDRER